MPHLREFVTAHPAVLNTALKLVRQGIMLCYSVSLEGEDIKTGQIPEEPD